MRVPEVVPADLLHPLLQHGIVTEMRDIAGSELLTLVISWHLNMAPESMASPSDFARSTFMGALGIPPHAASRLHAIFRQWVRRNRERLVLLPRPVNVSIKEYEAWCLFIRRLSLSLFGISWIADADGPLPFPDIVLIDLSLSINIARSNHFDEVMTTIQASGNHIISSTGENQGTDYIYILEDRGLHQLLTPVLYVEAKFRSFSTFWDVVLFRHGSLSPSEEVFYPAEGLPGGSPAYYQMLYTLNSYSKGHVARMGLSMMGLHGIHRSTIDALALLSSVGIHGNLPADLFSTAITEDVIDKFLAGDFSVLRTMNQQVVLILKTRITHFEYQNLFQIAVDGRYLDDPACGLTHDYLSSSDKMSGLVRSVLGLVLPPELHEGDVVDPQGFQIRVRTGDVVCKVLVTSEFFSRPVRVHFQDGPSWVFGSVVKREGSAAVVMSRQQVLRTGGIIVDEDVGRYGPSFFKQPSRKLVEVVTRLRDKVLHRLLGGGHDGCGLASLFHEGVVYTPSFALDVVQVTGRIAEELAVMSYNWPLGGYKTACIYPSPLVLQRREKLPPSEISVEFLRLSMSNAFGIIRLFASSLIPDGGRRKTIKELIVRVTDPSGNPLVVGESPLVARYLPARRSVSSYVLTTAELRAGITEDLPYLKALPDPELYRAFVRRMFLPFSSVDDSRLVREYMEYCAAQPRLDQSIPLPRISLSDHTGRSCSIYIEGDRERIFFSSDLYHGKGLPEHSITSTSEGIFIARAGMFSSLGTYRRLSDTTNRHRFYLQFVHYFLSLRIFIDENSLLEAAPESEDPWTTLVLSYLGTPNHVVPPRYDQRYFDVTFLRIREEYLANAYLSKLITKPVFKLSDINIGRVKLNISIDRVVVSEFLSTELHRQVAAIITNAVLDEPKLRTNAKQWRQTLIKFDHRDKKGRTFESYLRSRGLTGQEISIMIEVLSETYIAPNSFLYPHAILPISDVLSIRLIKQDNRVFDGLTRIYTRHSPEYAYLENLRKKARDNMQLREIVDHMKKFQNIQHMS